MPSVVGEKPSAKKEDVPVTVPAIRKKPIKFHCLCNIRHFLCIILGFIVTTGGVGLTYIFYVIKLEGFEAMERNWSIKQNDDLTKVLSFISPVLVSTGLFIIVCLVSYVWDKSDEDYKKKIAKEKEEREKDRYKPGLSLFDALMMNVKNKTTPPDPVTPNPLPLIPIVTPGESHTAAVNVSSPNLIATSDNEQNNGTNEIIGATSPTADSSANFKFKSPPLSSLTHAVQNTISNNTGYSSFSNSLDNQQTRIGSTQNHSASSKNVIKKLPTMKSIPEKDPKLFTPIQVNARTEVAKPIARVPNILKSTRNYSTSSGNSTRPKTGTNKLKEQHPEAVTVSTVGRKVQLPPMEKKPSLGGNETQRPNQNKRPSRLPPVSLTLPKPKQIAANKGSLPKVD